jgi:hypothetical protein
LFKEALVMLDIDGLDLGFILEVSMVGHDYSSQAAISASI